jgi:hypothetical protein
MIDNTDNYLVLPARSTSEKYFVSCYDKILRLFDFALINKRNEGNMNGFTENRPKKKPD